MSVMIVTSVGDIVIDLHTERCPLTTKNFLKLCKIKYYNGCLFHTVQKDFTAQTGDPTGKGDGGDSIYKFLYGDQARFFGDEIHPDLKHSKIGTVAMASSGDNLNASQFYFTLRDDIDYLDGKHTVFGEVAEGLDTLARINEAYVDEKERPYRNIRIKHTYILDDPFDDPPQLAELIPDASPEGKPKDEIDDEVRLEDDWVPLDEQLGPSEYEEIVRDKEAHSRAVLLETIGDIPEAEIKPPENVLFVCKLNPVTEDEDLNTIFSRFGNVVSADIIRDFKTGDSLCYAFIEFETVEACEVAYDKMNNALIDDRRIKVDYSQSVAKLWSQYRQKGKQTSKGGRGCFKCGGLDHIAKDCSGGDPPHNGTETQQQQQPPKYKLKEENRNNSRYEMVFEGDAPPLKSEQRNRHHERENEPEDGKRKMDRQRDYSERRRYEEEGDVRRKRSSHESRQRDRGEERRDREREYKRTHSDGLGEERRERDRDYKRTPSDGFGEERRERDRDRDREYKRTRSDGLGEERRDRDRDRDREYKRRTPSDGDKGWRDGYDDDSSRKRGDREGSNDARRYDQHRDEKHRRRR